VHVYPSSQRHQLTALAMLAAMLGVERRGFFPVELDTEATLDQEVLEKMTPKAESVPSRAGHDCAVVDRLRAERQVKKTRAWAARQPRARRI